MSLKSAGLDLVLENNDDYVTEQMEKQKRKFREMQNVLDQQYLLLRLIVQVLFRKSFLGNLWSTEVIIKY